MLDRLRLNDSQKPTPVNAKVATAQKQSIKTIASNETGYKTDSDASSARDDRFSGSEMYTPATEVFDESIKATNAEMERVKRELEAAKSVINQQKRELEETRNFKHTMEQALPSPSEADFPRGDAHVSSMQR